MKNLRTCYFINFLKSSLEQYIELLTILKCQSVYLAGSSHVPGCLIVMSALSREMQLNAQGLLNVLPSEAHTGSNSCVQIQSCSGRPSSLSISSLVWDFTDAEYAVASTRPSIKIMNLISG